MSFPSKNLIFKLWDKDTFDDVDPSAYKSMENSNDTERLPMDMGLTSFNMSHVELISPKGRRIRVGDVLQYRIQSRDFSGRNRITGGDFWYALLASPAKPQASTAGYIADYGNGTYDAFVLAAWPGSATFSLLLVHTSEACYHMRNIVWNSDGRMVWIGRYSSGGKTADARCFIMGHGTWSGKCEYPAYHAMGSTVFLCNKISGFPCKSLLSLGTNRTGVSERAAELTRGVEYLFKSPYFLKKVPVTNATLTIEGFELPKQDLPRCLADQEIPRVQGYWKDGNWTSLLCSFSDWTKKPLLTSCLSNMQVVLLGDSTTRQWRDSLIKLVDTVHVAVRSPSQSLWFRDVYESLNLTIYFQFHPYVIGSSFYRLADMKNEVDVLNNLSSRDCNYIVLLSPWAHFSQWTRDSYIQRVRLIRMAVLRLRQRCPHVPVVIKGPHPREHRNYASIVYSSDFYLREIERINREAFEGTGAFFLPVWDMNLAYPRSNVVHMPQQVIMEELKIFLGYVCDAITPRRQTESGQ